MSQEYLEEFEEERMVDPIGVAPFEKWLVPEEERSTGPIQKVYTVSIDKEAVRKDRSKLF